MLSRFVQPPRVSAQAATDWEKAAGGKMPFDVASVKQNFTPPGPGAMHSNVPLSLDTADFTPPAGGLFDSINAPVWAYVAFAYRLSFNQAQVLRAEAPKWMIDDRFDIQGRAAGNPTEDQYRLMVQSLLADRFKMTAHFETRQGPVYALVLARPGKTGSQLRPFPDGVPCSIEKPPLRARGGPASSGITAKTADGEFPLYCGLVGLGVPVPMPPSEPGLIHFGARNVTWEQIEQNFLVAMGGQLKVFDRPVLDQTGLSGSFDFSLEWHLPSPGLTAAAEDPGPTFTEALKEQLGLKIESTTGPITTIVIDHIERPTPN